MTRIAFFAAVFALMASLVGNVQAADSSAVKYVATMTGVT